MKKLLIVLSLLVTLGLTACVNDTSIINTTEKITTQDYKITYVNEMSNPYNVALFVTEDLSTSIAVNFEMPDSSKAYIEYAKINTNLFYRVQANLKTTNIQDKNVYLYEIFLDNLEPNTKYVYRVINEDASEKSEYYSFITMDTNDEEHSFLYLADPQETAEIGYMAYAHSIISVLEYSQATIDLAMFPGDVVNDHDIRSQWNLFFKYSSMFSTSIPMAVALGNHDIRNVTNTEVNNIEFDYFMNLPNNGPNLGQFDAVIGDKRDSSFDNGKTYSFDYGNAHIVVVNTEVYCDGTTTCAYSDSSNVEIMNEWIKNDFNSSDAEWKIVLLHRGPYSLSYNTYKVRENLVPVLEECGVDLVLAGHDHQYSRAIYNEGVLIPFSRSNDYTLGTVSVVSGLSYDLNFNSYPSSTGITYLSSNTSGTKFYGHDKSTGV